MRPRSRFKYATAWFWERVTLSPFSVFAFDVRMYISQNKTTATATKKRENKISHVNVWQRAIDGWLAPALEITTFFLITLNVLSCFSFARCFVIVSFFVVVACFLLFFWFVSNKSIRTTFISVRFRACECVCVLSDQKNMQYELLFTSLMSNDSFRLMPFQFANRFFFSFSSLRVCLCVECENEPLFRTTSIDH